MDREAFDVNSFGISDTKVVGDYQAAEDFLAGDGEDIKTIEEADAEAKKKAEALKKKQPLKAPIKKDEEEEEETEEKEEGAIDPFGEMEPKKDKTAETEEEVEEDKKEEEENKEGEPEVQAQNSYEELSKDLLKLGLFTEMEGVGLPKTGDELLNRFKAEGQREATQWLDDFIGRHGDDRKELFEAIFLNGVDPAEYIPVYNEVQKFEGMDITVEENQKRVYREFYRRLGWEEDKVEKRLQKTIDYGDLESETPDLLHSIVNQDKERLSEMEDQKKIQMETQKRADAEYKTGLQKLLNESLKTKDFKGVPVTEKRVREAFDFLYTPKYKTPNGQLLTEFDKFVLESKKPENLEDRLLLALLKLDNFDFKKIKQQAISEESKEIFSSLATKVTKDKTRATKTQSQATGGSEWSKNL